MNSVAIGLLLEVKPILTRKCRSQNSTRVLHCYQPRGKANAVPGPLDGCRTAGINASDTKLITPTEIAHTVCPRNNGTGIEKTLLEFSPLRTDTKSSVSANGMKHQP